MRIAIDAGHGSNTAGKRTPAMPVNIDFENDGIIDVKKGDSIREHTAAVGVATFLVEELKRCGIDTIKTGFNDNNPYNDDDTPLTTRQSMIKKAQCDYSISLHFNAFGDGSKFNSAEGVGIYIHNTNVKDSKKFAETVLKHLIKGTSQINRGIKPQALAMCNCKTLNVKAAILVELAFMTNQREATKLMGSVVFWKECAVEIAKGVCDYTGIKYVEIDNVPKKTVTKTSSTSDIKWVQTNLNKYLNTIQGLIPLKVDGIFSNKTRIAVLMYWETLGWNQSGEGTGWQVGMKTINALNSGKIK